MKQVSEYSELSEEFGSLKKQYQEQVELNNETDKAFVAKSHQLEIMSQDLTATLRELQTKQHMMTELQTELAAAQAQVIPVYIGTKFDAEKFCIFVGALKQSL